jgi:sugar lactone lactonase YvrE
VTGSFSPGAWRVETDLRNELGEHPLWDDSTGSLVWVDILEGMVHRLDAPGDLAHVRLGSSLGAVGLRDGGGFVAAVDQQFVFTDGDGNGNRDPIAAPVADGMRFNDAACDPAGRFLAGIVCSDPVSAAITGELVQLHVDGHIDVLLDGLIESNGLAWSLDGATLHFVDSGERCIRRYAYDCETGKLGQRQPDLCEFSPEQGTPDGLTIDAEGALWVALWQGSAVKRMSPEGRELVHLDLPVSQPTCVAFGTVTLGRIYVTSAWEGMTLTERAAEPLAGALFSAPFGVKGTPAHRFRG